MSEEPLVTIIIPTYNAAKYLNQCLSSIALLKTGLIELLIIDGGSQDGTNEIIQKYSNIINHHISEPDKGIYDAMNKGVKLAKGKFIYFLGADDTLQPTFANALSFLKSENHVYYGDVFYKSKNKIYGGIFTRVRLLKENICHQSMFYSRRIFQKYEFDLHYKWMADYKLNIELFADSSVRFEYLPILIAEYNGAGGSAQNRDMRFAFRSYGIILQKWGWSYFILKILNKIKQLLNKSI